jgi:hypothetical protein
MSQKKVPLAGKSRDRSECCTAGLHTCCGSPLRTRNARIGFLDDIVFADALGCNGKIMVSNKENLEIVELSHT